MAALKEKHIETKTIASAQILTVGWRRGWKVGTLHHLWFVEFNSCGSCASVSTKTIVNILYFIEYCYTELNLKLWVVVIYDLQWSLSFNLNYIWGSFRCDFYCCQKNLSVYRGPHLSEPNHGPPCSGISCPPPYEGHDQQCIREKR